MKYWEGYNTHPVNDAYGFLNSFANIASAEDCARLCLENDDCSVFVYNHGQINDARQGWNLGP